MTRALVTGARGKTGVPLAELLVARPGVDVLAGSSAPATVALDGVRPTSFSWDDPAGWAAAGDASTPSTSSDRLARTRRS